MTQEFSLKIIDQVDSNKRCIESITNTFYNLLHINAKNGISYNVFTCFPADNGKLTFSINIPNLNNDTYNDLYFCNFKYGSPLMFCILAINIESIDSNGKPVDAVYVSEQTPLTTTRKVFLKHRIKDNPTFKLIEDGFLSKFAAFDSSITRFDRILPSLQLNKN